MPRQPDPDVEGRILDVAHKLWKHGGDKALTMRAVARAARTNTPAVYRRFKDKKDIQRALLLRIRQDVIAEMEKAKTAAEACERYLDFALNHPYEYELFYRHDHELLHKRGHDGVHDRLVNRPGVDAMRSILAEGLGGAPEDHARLALALWMVGHGAAMLMIAKMIAPESQGAARSVFRDTVQMLLREGSSMSEASTKVADGGRTARG